MYILLNRKNIVVDILKYIRYIKLQPSNNIIISCPKEEGTGVIGSDCNTHYILMKTDITNSPDAVRVIEIENLSINIKPNLYKFDDESQSFIYRYTLDEAKELKQEQNKLLFTKYLISHPLIWTDGKEYGITLEDQFEINLNLNKYQLALQTNIDSPSLEWHARHEKNQSWTYENLINLFNSINQVIQPIYQKMQEYKIAIYNANTIEELEQIELNYSE